MITRTLTVVPAEGLVDAGKNLITDATSLAFAAAALGVAIYLVRGLFKVQTALSAILVICVAALLIWGINAVRSNKAGSTLDDTITEYGLGPKVSVTQTVTRT